MKLCLFLSLKVLLLVALAVVSYYSFFWMGESYERNNILKNGDEGVRRAIQFFKEGEIDKALATLYFSESLSAYRKPENVARLEKETACLLGKGFAIKSRYCLAEGYLKYAETLSYNGGLTPLCSKAYENLDRISESCAWQRDRIYFILSNSSPEAR